MKKKENKFLTRLLNLDIAIASAVLALLIFLTVAGVVYRYVLSKPFTWLEEVQLACMVWVVFAAGGAAFRTGNHVAIEMVVDLFPRKVQKVIEALISVVVVIVLAYLFKQSIGFIQIFLKSGRSTPMLDIPYSVIYGIAPVSFLWMIFNYFYALFTGVKSEAKEAIANNE